MRLRQFKYRDILKDPRLGEDEVHVWSIRINEFEDRIRKQRHVVSQEEKEQVLRYRHREDQMRCLAGKILARVLLSEYLHIQEKDLRIRVSALGKPYLLPKTGKETIHYSISHSKDLVIAAFTRYPAVGADVEWIRPFPEDREIARAFFTAEESHRILESKNKDLFFFYWTAKEAYVKATGDGLHKSLDTFCVEHGTITERGRIQPGWQVLPLYTEPGYAAHVAVQTKGDF